MANLETLAAAIREHWREHERTLYRQLQTSGELVERSEARAKRTLEMAAELEAAGSDPIQAMGEARREVAFSRDL